MAKPLLPYKLRGLNCRGSTTARSGNAEAVVGLAGHERTVRLPLPTPRDELYIPSH